MEILDIVLPIIINVLLIVLLVCCIILVIKCIYIIDKAKSIALNIENKVNSLNSLFMIVEMISDKVSGLTEKCVNYVEGLLIKLFNRNHDEDVLEDEEELENILKKERKK